MLDNCHGFKQAKAFVKKRSRKRQLKQPADRLYYQVSEKMQNSDKCCTKQQEEDLSSNLIIKLYVFYGLLTRSIACCKKLFHSNHLKQKVTHNEWKT